MLELDQYENLLAAIFGDDHSPRFPDVWHLGFVDENDDEITGSGYARVPVANDSDTWGYDGDSDAVANLDPIDGGTPTDDDWPDIHGVVLFDESGQRVFTAFLGAPTIPVEDEPLGIEAGALTISLPFGSSA